MEYQPPVVGVYSNLYDALSLTPGASLIITNKGKYPVFIAQGSHMPHEGGYPIEPNATAIVHGHNGLGIWVLGGLSPVYVQSLVNTVMPFTAVDLPHYLYTSDKERYRRLRVDIAQTGFFEGREFRTFYEFSIAAGQSAFIRVTVPLDIILHSFSASVDEGKLRVRSFVGSTPTGTFSTPLPVFPKNNMAERPSPIYIPQVQVATGGTGLTGGTQLDVARIATSTATSQQTTVGLDIGSERGVAVGTYYYQLENFGSGVCTGVLSGWWEERPLPNF